MAVGAVKDKLTEKIQEGTKKLIKKLGWGYILQWIPGFGWLIPGDIMLVWRTMKDNLTSPEAVLMFGIAGCAYLIQITIGVVEIWFDLGIITTLITWAVASFFALWLYLRRTGATQVSSETTPKQKEEKPTKANQAKKKEPSFSSKA